MFELARELLLREGMSARMSRNDDFNDDDYIGGAAYMDQGIRGFLDDLSQDVTGGDPLDELIESLDKDQGDDSPFISSLRSTKAEKKTVNGDSSDSDGEPVKWVGGAQHSKSPRHSKSKDEEEDEDEETLTFNTPPPSPKSLEVKPDQNKIEVQKEIERIEDEEGDSSPYTVGTEQVQTTPNPIDDQITAGIASQIENIYF